MEEVPNDVVVNEIMPRSDYTAKKLTRTKRWRDGINALPLEIVVNEIMPRFDGTTKEFIGTVAPISRLWRYLSTQHPDLIFSEDNDLTGEAYLNAYISFIDNTIMSWIRDAISRNVEEVDLRLSDVGVFQGFTFDDDLFFNPPNSCITRMTLNTCQLDPPNGAINWKKLESLCLVWVRLNKHMIEKIFSGSPCLKSLKLENCHCYRQIEITSKSFTKLVFSRFDAGGVVKIDAPNISSLTIKGKLSLRKLKLDDMSSLKEAELDYSMDPSVPLRTQERIFKGLLDRLKHVKAFGAVTIIAKKYSDVSVR
ncbi:ribonuclease H-like domain-containing protein [Tanacetum coccineum]